ncbi:TetR/AcrR family transcriptional regulator [Actinoplanes sp. NPDC048967]|uniref:TetR/AcrR family transcriptional regulator n=1 Tax=Actinoplanes sp. NPDC048967 TaxID=3155269 RepID=UPI0033D11B36
MTTMPGRRRAPGMTPEQRRETIVQAALPLVAEYGAAVTTAQIARAAGIGEATIFRVFDDKDDVLQACVTKALDPTQVLQDLQSISLDQPLATRLTDAVEALDAHLARMGTVIGALHASGTPHRRPRATPTNDDQPDTRSSGRDASRAATRQALSELFEPDQRHLRLPAETLANAFLALFFGRERGRDQQPPRVPAEQLVDLFLHGALTTKEPA